MKRFEGEKKIVLASDNLLGSSSYMGYLLVISGGIASFFAFINLVFMSISQNNKFDYSSMKWK